MRRFCYSDVIALYCAGGLSEGVPYWTTRRVSGRDRRLHEPIGVPVHPLGDARPRINAGQWFYDLNAVVLGRLAVASVAPMLGLRQRRPWDVAMFAVAPALLLTATVNWDLLAVGWPRSAFAWARRRAGVAGVLLGLATAAKLWPLFSSSRCCCSRYGRPEPAGAGRHRDGGRGAGSWSTCRSCCGYPGQLVPVLRAQHRRGDRLGHFLVRRAVPDGKRHRVAGSGPFEWLAGTSPP